LRKASACRPACWATFSETRRKRTDGITGEGAASRRGTRLSKPVRKRAVLKQELEVTAADNGDANTDRAQKLLVDGGDAHGTPVERMAERRASISRITDLMSPGSNFVLHQRLVQKTRNFVKILVRQIKGRMGASQPFFRIGNRPAQKVGDKFGLMIDQTRHVDVVEKVADVL
jgi:hypothetical protein